MSEIRENWLTGEWVVIAPERAKRGGNLATPVARPEIPAYAANCPFCPGNEAETEGEHLRVEDASGAWLMRSLVNKFSALSPEGEVSASAVGHPICAVTMNGVGLHEVLVENRRHNASLAESPVSYVELVLQAYRERFLAFYQDPRIRHVILFKNHGAEAGASQQHPHSQIVGLPMIPGQVMDRIERSRRFHERNGCCLGCTLVEQERASGERILAENAHFVAFIPYAALSPYHLWIFPKRHEACFSNGLPETLPALAEILRDVLRRIHGLLDNPPYNLVIRSLGPTEADAAHFHWYLSMVPRVVKTAGFELGTGMYINPSSPEDRARALREFRPAASA